MGDCVMFLEEMLGGLVGVDDLARYIVEFVPGTICAACGEVGADAWEHACGANAFPDHGRYDFRGCQACADYMLLPAHERGAVADDAHTGHVSVRDIIAEMDGTICVFCVFCFLTFLV